MTSAFFLAFVWFLLGHQAAAPSQENVRPITVWTTHSLQKVRPGDATPPTLPHDVQLFAAQNEFEPFQIVLRANAAAVNNVDVDVTDLAGPAGVIGADAHVTIYLEKYMTIATPSSIEGAAGEWPDPLVPKVDRYTGERRNAFPLKLAPGRNQPLWIEVYVPLGTPPGVYRGAATIKADSAFVDSVPITLEVWNFALPSTSSFPTSFGFNGIGAMREHFGRYTSDRDLLDLTRVYQKAALLHRLSTHGGSMVPPRIPQGAESIDWSRYDGEMAPLLDGTLLTSRDPLPGATATTAELRVPPGLTEAQRRPYYQQWIRHFREKKWLDKLFLYLWDEPTPEKFDQVATRGRAAHQSDREVRNLVTIAWNSDLAGVVDIWTPLINCLEAKPGFPPYCDVSAPMAKYSPELAAGKRLWWYQSCASHGCNIVGGEYFRGWPSYMIDTPPVGNRIFQWLAWEYRIGGELYFNTNEAYQQPANGGKDPWDSVLLFGGNGDGTLFYPGTPARIGGTTQIPIESIRLKLIREGLEDYEYLHLCEAAGLQPLAKRVASSMATNLYSWDHRPESLYVYRRQMGEALSKATPSKSGGR